MVLFETLSRLEEDLNREYFCLAREAHAAYTTERSAGFVLTAHAKGFLLRRRLDHVRWAALVIQRFWRGHLGRLRYNIFLKHHQTVQRKAYFDQKATAIQQWFRGYYSRKYVHSFHARRRYIQGVLDAGTALREKSKQAAHAAAAGLQKQWQEKENEELLAKLESLHHLVSTGAQASVLRTPMQEATGTVPSVGNATVEEIIRSCNRGQVCMSPSQSKLRPSNPLLMQLDLLSSEMLGNLQFRSLQSLPHYDCLATNRALEKAVEERAVLWLHPKPFLAGSKSPDALFHSLPTNQLLEAWVQPEDGVSGSRPGRGRMDDGAKKVASKLFAETWRPQAEFGKSLKMSSGV